LTGRTPPGMADEPRQPNDALVKSGTRAFRNTILALFCAGFATFALLYYVQPLLPVFSESFGLGAAQASLALSVTTGLMAPAMLVPARSPKRSGESP
jgi:MFS transporter, YNFM family, putative membrane transport protein